MCKMSIASIEVAWTLNLMMYAYNQIFPANEDNWAV